MTSTLFNAPCIDKDLALIIKSNGTITGGMWSCSNTSVLDDNPSKYPTGTTVSGDVYWVHTNPTTGQEWVYCYVELDGCYAQYDSMLVTSYDHIPSAPMSITGNFDPNNCSGQDLNLSTDTVLYAAGYIWTTDLWSSELSPGETIDPAWFITVGAASTTDIVTVQATNGCGTSNSAIKYFYSKSVVDCGGERNNISNKSSFIIQKEYSIFPNPASTNVTIAFNHPAEIYKVSLLNIDGQVVQSYLTPGVNFNISKLPTGLYLLLSSSATEQHYSKLSIIR